jgi:transposase
MDLHFLWVSDPKAPQEGERKTLFISEVGVIPPEKQAEILALHFNDKRPVRAIARMLGINRDSVRTVIRRRSVSLVPHLTKRQSTLEPYREEIKQILDKDPLCPATAMMNRLRSLGFMGSITALRKFLRKTRAVPVRAREAYLRLTFEPGEAAQVDWGEFGDVFHDGIKIHCFAMVLCFSRFIYLEFTRSEKFEDFIRCHENAFRFFGGVPRECWYDNLGSAVTERIGQLIRFNSRFMAYMGHHGIRPHACNVARGNEKGRVEDLIKYIRMNFWPGRVFSDFEDLQKQSIIWRNQFANQREHRTTRRVVRLLFESEEKKALLSMNPNRYDTDEIFSRVVPSDFHVAYDSNRYSVPWTLVGMTVTLRINPQLIRIFYNERLIAHHIRSFLKNQVFTNESHREGLIDRKPGNSREGWQLASVKNIGPQMADYIELLRSGHRSLRSEISKILALSTVYGNEAVHEACKELLASAIVGVEALELTLRRIHHPAQSKLQPEPINFQNQKLNRITPAVDLRRYDALLFESKETQSASEEEKNDGNPNGDKE